MFNVVTLGLWLWELFRGGEVGFSCGYGEFVAVVLRDVCGLSVLLHLCGFEAPAKWPKAAGGSWLLWACTTVPCWASDITGNTMGHLSLNVEFERQCGWPRTFCGGDGASCSLRDLILCTKKLGLNVKKKSDSKAPERQKYKDGVVVRCCLRNMCSLAFQRSGVVSPFHHLFAS